MHYRGEDIVPPLKIHQLFLVQISSWLISWKSGSLHSWLHGYNLVLCLILVGVWVYTGDVKFTPLSIVAAVVSYLFPLIESMVIMAVFLDHLDQHTVVSGCSLMVHISYSCSSLFLSSCGGLRLALVLFLSWGSCFTWY